MAALRQARHPLEHMRTSPADQLSVRDMVRLMTHLAVPTALANLLEYLPVTFTLAIVGHAASADATLHIGALALSRSYFNITGQAVCWGLLTALRTLCPQAAGRGRGRDLHPLYCQRAFLVTLGGFGLCALAAFHCEAVLLALRQNGELAKATAQYALRLALSLAPITWMTILQRVLQAEGHVWANFWMCAAVCATTPFVQAAAVARYGWLGAAWGSAAYNSLYVVAFGAYLCCAGFGRVFVPRLRTLDGAGMRQFVALAVPGALGTLVEWASFELVTLAGGTRQSAEVVVGALSLLQNLASLAGMCYIGLGVAVAVNIGHEVGAGHARNARRYVRVAMCVAFLFGVALALAANVCPRLLFSALTNDAEVLDLATPLAPQLGLVIVAEAMNQASRGAVAGAGQQAKGALVSLCAWYGVGAPLAAGLLYGLDLDKGAVSALLYCLVVASSTSAAGQLAILGALDWDRAVALACRRLDESADPLVAAAADKAAAAEPEAVGGPPAYLRTVVSDESLDERDYHDESSSDDERRHPEHAADAMSALTSRLLN